MKRVFAPVLAAVLAAALLCGCLSYLPDGFDEQQVAENAQQAIEYFNARDFEALSAMFREDKRAELTAERWEEAFGDLLDEYGAFKEFDVDQGQLSSYQDEETGEEFGMAQAMAVYENGSLAHNLLFDIDSMLVAYRIGIVEEE